MITVVTGPPCSGKTTYVRTHAQPGDVIIDYDIIAQALGSPSTHDHSPTHRHLAMMARRAAITAALTTRAVDVWIVDTDIGPANHRAYQQAGAHIITMRADTAELHRRASAERPALWHGLIDKWQPGVAVRDGSREW